MGGKRTFMQEEAHLSLGSIVGCKFDTGPVVQPILKSHATAT